MSESKSADTANVTFLEQTLWQQFRDTEAPDSFAQRWLALQCHYIGDTRSGVLVLGAPDTGPFSPVATWPVDEQPSQDLAGAIERCLKEKRPVVIEGETNNLALPIEIDGLVHGAVAICLESEKADNRSVLWQLRWGSAWLEALLRRQQNKDDSTQKERTILGFDLIGLALEQPSFEGSCNALVTELAHRLKCDPVSIGFTKNARIKLKSVSHSAQFGERMSYVRQIESAMEEAVDQQTVVLYPRPADWDYRVTRAHQDLIETHKSGTALTVPMQAEGEVIGAITFERDIGQAFSEDDVELLDSAASVLGPLLYLQQTEDFSLWRKIHTATKLQLQRLIGPHYLGRKLLAISLTFLMLFFSLFTGDYRVTAPAVVEGMIQRAIVAPFDGYIETQMSRAGENVAEGQLLATLNDQDLSLERIRWSTKVRQRMAEYDQALARRERSSANIVQAELEQAQAQVQLLDHQLQRTQIRAPFAGVIVSGDLSQNIGSAVRRGQELFRLAPLEDHRVILEVDEADIMDMRVGQQGSLRLAALPEQALEYKVTLITSIAEQAEGRNYFRVEAVLKNEISRLRPGMQGVAKTTVEDRLVISIWSEKLLDWLRLFFWTWSP